MLKKPWNRAVAKHSSKSAAKRHGATVSRYWRVAASISSTSVALAAPHLSSKVGKKPDLQPILRASQVGIECYGYVFYLCWEKSPKLRQAGEACAATRRNIHSETNTGRGPIQHLGVEFLSSSHGKYDSSPNTEYACFDGICNLSAPPT